MSGIELKPCPFCGSARIEDVGGLQSGPNPQCSACGSRPPGPFSEGRRSAVDVWNTRAPQWQPIETAPRDGTRLLLFGDGDTVVAYFNVGYGTWDDGDHHDDIQGLTHWQPLPAAP